MKKYTLSEIDKMLGRLKENNQIRSCKGQKVRDSWYTAQFCRFHGWLNAEISVPEKETGDDAVVHYQDNKYPFQAVQVCPDDFRVKELSPLTGDDKDIRNFVTQAIELLVDQKTDHTYANPENMNLLVYCNGDIVGAHIHIDIEAYFDQKVLENKYSDSKFSTISVLFDKLNNKGLYEVLFLKGQLEDLATLSH